MIHAWLFFYLALQAASPQAAQHMQAGISADKERKFDVAITEFKKATEIDPKYVDGFVSLGQAYMESGDYGAAIPPLKHAVELNADFVPAHQLLGYALLSQGYAGEALPHLQRGTDKTALGIAEIQTGHLPEAVADIQARAHQAMAENYFVLRRMPDAENEYRAALKQRPNLPEAHLALGEVYAGAFKWPQAEEEFRLQVKSQPGNAEAAYRLGEALLEQGKVHEAREELKRADHLLPDMPEVLYSLGKAASLEGDVATAEQEWTKLLSIEQQSSLAAQAHFGLAGIYRKQGKKADAQREMKAFEELQSSPQAQPSGEQDSQH